MASSCRCRGERLRGARLAWWLGRGRERAGDLVTPLTEAQAALVAAHVPQVRRVAGRMRRGTPSFVSQDDLLQWGCLGLISAATRWSPDRGASFWTFAEPRVRGAMVDGLREGSWPRGARRDLRALADDPDCLTPARRREVLEIAALGGAATNPVHDLPGWVLGATPYETADDALARRDARATVRRLLRRATRREARLLVDYHCRGRSLRAIARDHGLCESRISQVLIQARRRLRETTTLESGV